jgi:hypothetical protein
LVLLKLVKEGKIADFMLQFEIKNWRKQVGLYVKEEVNVKNAINAPKFCKLDAVIGQ